MKKVLFLATLFFLAALPGSAQLYVSPGSYVYNNNQYVYVKQGVNLQNNSNFYLRNGAQLLQGTTGTSANQGQGNLSLYQEGTVDNFEYNYWCSPVGGALAAVGNSNFGITQLYSPVDVTNSTAAIMLPTSNTNGIASPLSISQRWVFKYTMSTNYSAWSQVNSASTIAAGEGFTMKGTSGTDMTMVNGVANNPGAAQRYDFRGKPNDGNINIPLATGQWTLTGNPYPSAIDLAAFLVAETNCTGSAYFWEQDKNVNSHLLVAYQGGYGTYSGGTNIYVPAVFTNYDGAGIPLATVGSGSSYARRFSPIGQGFMLEGAANASAVMKNSYRVFTNENASTSVFERVMASTESEEPTFDNLPQIPSVSGFDYSSVSNAPTPQIRFNVSLNDSGIRQIVLAFKDEATDGIDHALDSKSPGDALPADLYFAIEGKEFVISAVNFDVNKKIPIGLKNAADASYKITVSEMINFDEADHVYVHDKLNDVYHEITLDEFQIDMPAGNNSERYEITFTDQALGLPQATKQELLVTQNNASQVLTIHNPGLVDVTDVYLFDISGKRVMELKNQERKSSYELSTAGLSESVYVVKIVSKEKSDFAQKILVSHSKASE
ncbi:T9SS type A sorting domain-containing protein [Flavobacterium silvaticum]|uniref:T9SS type A sorting domain-containing protein n=1 Tax=Flavobacterium silvaticum TaxID=1852020 RepID=A0A972FNX1_9FLAO|nr:T9SS type A sorting domain-containing protein [Flavobacterium silvaticum]NMH26719.1 T9SS type A sorting domain-containing protein [Flavobacterium silvaticum]